MYYKNKLVFFILLGNILDHYNTALYIYLASILSKLFFPNSDPSLSLFLSYSVLIIQNISWPLGSIYFARLAERIGAIKSLYYSLLGIAFATCIIAIIPTYQDIGIFAPLLLVFTRFIQTFFGAGEHTVSSIFVLDIAEQKNKDFFNSLFIISTYIGISFSSFAAYLVTISYHPEIMWRIPYILGIITSIFAVLFRYYYRDVKIDRNDLMINKKDNKKLSYSSIILLGLINIFWMLSYYIPFVFWNDFISWIHLNINKSILLKNNTIFLYYQSFILFFLVYLLKNIRHVRILLWSLFFLIIICIPSFLLLKYDSLIIIEFVRLLFITIVTIFSIKSGAYVYDICKSNKIYSYNSYGLIIGNLLGRTTVIICLGIYKISGLIIGPAIYITFITTILFLLIMIREFEVKRVQA